MKENRCGVPCAHAGDVHDCKGCSACVAFTCGPLCIKCPKEGRDTCTCPETEVRAELKGVLV